MKKIRYITATTFCLGLLWLLFLTFGELAWNFYGVGLYPYEASLLIAWVMLMFGTAFYYGLMGCILYPEQARRRREKGKRDEF